jgi:hypothetical protein
MTLGVVEPLVWVALAWVPLDQNIHRFARSACLVVLKHPIDRFHRFMAAIQPQPQRRLSDRARISQASPQSIGVSFWQCGLP